MHQEKRATPLTDKTHAETLRISTELWNLPVMELGASLTLDPFSDSCHITKYRSLLSLQVVERWFPPL